MANSVHDKNHKKSKCDQVRWKTDSSSLIFFHGHKKNWFCVLHHLDSTVSGFVIKSDSLTNESINEKKDSYHMKNLEN